MSVSVCCLYYWLYETVAYTERSSLPRKILGMSSMGTSEKVFGPRKPRVSGWKVKIDTFAVKSFSWFLTGVMLGIQRGEDLSTIQTNKRKSASFHCSLFI